MYIYVYIRMYAYIYAYMYAYCKHMNAIPGQGSPPPGEGGGGLAGMMRRLQGEAGARPSWTVGFEAAVTALRVAVKTVARDVATIRLLTDNALPRGLLPSGVARPPAPPRA